MHIVIKGQTPAQKNRQQMAVNRTTGKPFPVTNKIAKAWQKDAAKQLGGMNAPKITSYPTAMTVVFTVVDNRERDMDNMLSSVQDALVKAGIIEKDCWQKLRPVTIDVAGIDKENPRAEIWLEEPNE